MAAGHYSPVLLTPSSSMVPSSGWGHARLDDPRLSSVRRRLDILRAGGVTIALVVREFHRRRIAPLQRHSLLMWAFFRLEDPMRLHPERVSVDVLDGMLQILIGETIVGLPHGGRPLYKYKNGAGLIQIMPRFHRWGCFWRASRGLGTTLS
ncbi:hypothetical protein D1007_46467 [Hordeum vulgare]|nr:hypothetical protein D1007_46467 [Hordeum vulgare]